MNVWTYVIAVDGGAAPNFDPPATTLTICKPRIRKQAKRGDLVLAFNGKRLNPIDPHSVCWAGVVTEVIPMKDYWNTSRFKGKKPGRSRRPDNIYRPTPTGDLERVENETHTPADYARDVNGENALVLQPSWHFGPAGATLPEAFNLRMIDGRRGHRRRVINERVWDELKKWLDHNAPVRSSGISVDGDIPRASDWHSPRTAGHRRC
jgi:hypothetical protein